MNGLKDQSSVMFRYNVAAFLELVLEIQGFRVSLKSRDFERIHMTNIGLYSNVTQVYGLLGTCTKYPAILGFGIQGVETMRPL